MLGLSAKGRLVRSTESASGPLLGKASILLLLSLGSVACRGAVVVAVGVTLRIRGVV